MERMSSELRVLVRQFRYEEPKAKKPSVHDDDEQTGTRVSTCTAKLSGLTLTARSCSSLRASRTRSMGSWSAPPSF